MRKKLVTISEENSLPAEVLHLMREYQSLGLSEEVIKERFKVLFYRASADMSGAVPEIVEELKKLALGKIDRIITTKKVACLVYDTPDLLRLGLNPEDLVVVQEVTETMLPNISAIKEILDRTSSPLLLPVAENAVPTASFTLDLNDAKLTVSKSRPVMEERNEGQDIDDGY